MIIIEYFDGDWGLGPQPVRGRREIPLRSPNPQSPIPIIIKIFYYNHLKNKIYFLNIIFKIIKNG